MAALQTQKERSPSTRPMRIPHIHTSGPDWLYRVRYRAFSGLRR